MDVEIGADPAPFSRRQAPTGAPFHASGAVDPEGRAILSLLGAWLLLMIVSYPVVARLNGPERVSKPGR